MMVSVNVFAGNKTKIFSDMEYGYLYHYPSDWHASIYRSGVVLSQVQNRRGSGLQVRVRSMSTKTKGFVRQYLLNVKSGLGATLCDEQYGVNSGIDYVVLELSAIRGGVEDSLYHKLMFQKNCIIKTAERRRDA
ncbi:hypothetical protein A9Q81_09815 [Gammaproteobacteria bacterium 42_54_T18]|nr:hypothetical protein A9Q81_09815 [Gammaproteobacteria bacterium 42_54_T18]